MPTPVDGLVEALLRGEQVPAVLPLFRRLLTDAVTEFNERLSPRSLVRLATEVVPTHPRHVADVRGRMGTLIELGLAYLWDEAVVLSAYKDWRVAVNYVTEYPDLYVRDGNGGVRLRIETKALHDEADEGAARFDTVTPLIDPSADVLVVAGWGWRQLGRGNRALVYPVISVADAFGAVEIANERDTRFKITGGVFKAGGQPFVRSRRGKYVKDPGNYGKLNRIIHHSRTESDLSEEVSRLGKLLQTIFPE